MRWFLTVLGVLFGVIVFLFLDYSLPSRQTVRITDAYNRLTDIGANAIFYASPDTGTVQNAQGQRDVRFINTARANGKPYVYRNEDTGWIWPPYFKYDSSNLQAEATDMQSSAASPQWVSITSYGWRISWASIYPNAISMRPVAGPDVRPFNWPAVLILLVLGALLFLIWRMWNQFRERTIDPAVRSADEA
ncbi:DUF1523 family protein [Paracoccus sp. (in: a-proteobacteria)]